MKCDKHPKREAISIFNDRKVCQECIDRLPDFPRAVIEAARSGSWMQRVKLALWEAHQRHGSTHFSRFIPEKILDEILSKAYDEAHGSRASRRDCQDVL